jgi:hypothetical protein
MLAEPAPPMTSPDDLLRFARRAQARHRTRLGIGLAAAAALVAIAAVPLLTRTHAPDNTVIAAPTSAAPVPVAALLPEGVAVTAANPSGVWVARGLADVPTPTGDLCQAELPNRFRVQVEAGSCEVFTIRGIQIRTGTYTVPQHAGAGTPTVDVLFAIHYQDNKAIMAFQIARSGEPGLSARQLAETLVP